MSLGNLGSLENLEQVDGEWDVERLGSLINFGNPLLLSVKNLETYLSVNTAKHLRQGVDR